MKQDLKSLSQFHNVFHPVLLVMKTFLLFTVKLVIAIVILPLSFTSFILNSILIPVNRLISFLNRIAIQNSKASKLISKTLENTGKSTEKPELSDKKMSNNDGNNNSNTSSKVIAEMSLKQYNNLKQYKTYAGRLNDIMIINKKIHSVVQMIEDLALQTNTLSLNAAVEAAKAGDKENGFAEISSELKNLSKNTSSALKEINNIFNDTIERISKNTDTLNRGKDIDELYYRMKNLFKAFNAEYSSFTKKAGNSDQSVMRIKGISEEKTDKADNNKSNNKTVTTHSENLNESDVFIKEKKPTLH